MSLASPPEGVAGWWSAFPSGRIRIAVSEGPPAGADQSVPPHRLRVLAVMPSLEPSGGAEQSFAAVAPLLVERNIDLHLAVFGGEPGLGARLAAAGIVVTPLGTGDESDGYWMQVRALRRLVRSVRPDLVHATLHRPVVAASFATLGLRSRLLVTWANTPLDARSQPGLDRRRVWLAHTLEMVSTTLARARFHAVTEGVAAACRSRYRVRAGRVRVAERGRDAQRFAPCPPEELDALRTSLGMSAGQRIILAVGRIVHQKNHERLVHAFDAIAGQYPDAVLLIAGERRDAARTVDAALAAARHGDRIRLLGQRSDVPALLQIATMIVCSSRREGAAGALIEAMATGTPIVSTRLDGLEGVLEHGRNALVVEPAALEDAMSTVLDDPGAARARALAARADFDARFTLERAADSLAAVYYWSAGSCG